MKIEGYYSHNSGVEILKKNVDCLNDLKSAIKNCKIQFAKGAPPKIKRHFKKELAMVGWIDGVKVGHSRLTINHFKNEIGVCLQIGNVARTYADILKLSHLSNNRIIQVGIIIVPHIHESKKLGDNYASFERLKKEIELFANEISVPLALIGLKN